MASRSVNKVILIGNVGQDPEVRYTSSGLPVTTFSVATNEVYKDQQEQKFKERTQWHNIIAWTKLAEFCGQYVKKGSKVFIEGKIQYRSYDDKNGIKRTVTEIVADQLLLLDPKSESAVPPVEQSNAEPPQTNGEPPKQSNEEGDLPF